jgi:hypothetical protein
MTELSGLPGGVVVSGFLGTRDCRFFPKVSGVDSFMVGKVRVIEGLNELDLNSSSDVGADGSYWILELWFPPWNCCTHDMIALLLLLVGPQLPFQVYGLHLQLLYLDSKGLVCCSLLEEKLLCLEVGLVG